MVWTHPRRSSRKWRSESVVRYQCSVWQHDRGKKNRHNFNWQERSKGDNHWYCCTNWCKSRGKRNGESGKVPRLKERDWKIVETQNRWSYTFSDRSPQKCHKRIWWVDWKATDNKQCWSDAKDYIDGNCKNIVKSVEDVKKRTFC